MFRRLDNSQNMAANCVRIESRKCFYSFKKEEADAVKHRNQSLSEKHAENGVEKIGNYKLVAFAINGA